MYKAFVGQRSVCTERLEKYSLGDPVLVAVIRLRLDYSLQDVDIYDAL